MVEEFVKEDAARRRGRRVLMKKQREDMVGEFVNEDAARRSGRRVCLLRCTMKTWQEILLMKMQ